MGRGRGVSGRLPERGGRVLAPGRHTFGNRHLYVREPRGYQTSASTSSATPANVESSTSAVLSPTPVVVDMDRNPRVETHTPAATSSKKVVQATPGPFGYGFMEDMDRGDDSGAASSSGVVRATTVVPPVMPNPLRRSNGGKPASIHLRAGNMVSDDEDDGFVSEKKRRVSRDPTLTEEEDFDELNVNQCVACNRSLLGDVNARMCTRCDRKYCHVCAPSYGDASADYFMCIMCIPLEEESDDEDELPKGWEKRGRQWVNAQANIKFNLIQDVFEYEKRLKTDEVSL